MALIGGYLAFAVAFCAKQHLVVAPALSTVLLLAGWWRGRVSMRAILAAHLVAATATLAYLAIEDVATGGRMSQAAFVLPGGPFRSLNRASWGHVAWVFAEIVKKLPGPIVLMIACLFTNRSRTTRTDRLLGLYLMAELASLVPLCRNNQGSADNYALTAAILACILIARAIDRATDGRPIRVPIAATIALGLVLLLARDLQFIERSLRAGREDEARLRSILDDPDIAPYGLYFVDRPDLNRRFGRVDLIHDEWLYGAFEQVGAAEPRSAWLRPALSVGPVRRVILPDDASTVPGLPGSLADLGYARHGQFGPYRVWGRP